MNSLICLLTLGNFAGPPAYETAVGKFLLLLLAWARRVPVLRAPLEYRGFSIGTE
jgi:hypothetical protein